MPKNKVQIQWSPGSDEEQWFDVTVKKLRRKALHRNDARKSSKYATCFLVIKFHWNVVLIDNMVPNTNYCFTNSKARTLIQ